MRENKALQLRYETGFSFPIDIPLWLGHVKQQNAQWTHSVLFPAGDCALQVDLRYREREKTTLQFLSKRWPDGSKSKAHSLLLTTKRNWKQPCGQHSHTGVGQDLRGQNKMLLGSILGPNRLKRPAWQRTWFELLWHRETCSYLARAPPAGRCAELRLLGQLQTTCRSLWRRPGRGKELRQSKSLVRLTKGAKGPVIAQSVPKATIFVQSRFRAVR